MSVGGIEPFPGLGGAGAAGFSPAAPPGVDNGAVVNASGGPNRAFGDLVMDGIDRLESTQANADQLSVQAATGDLQAMHDYTIAATEASVTTQLTVAVRNKAVEAFNEIMRMQV